MGLFGLVPNGHDFLELGAAVARSLLLGRLAAPDGEQRKYEQERKTGRKRLLHGAPHG
jgi:hypothetical protein